VVVRRCLYLISLFFWIGGMVVLGALAALATFDALEASLGVAGRLEAVAVFRGTLRRFRFFEFGPTTTLLGCLVTLSYQRRRPGALGIRIATGLTILGVTLYLEFSVTGQIAKVESVIASNVALRTDMR